MNTSTNTTTPSERVQIAREYYNSNDADTFYFTIWGGEDIHVGLYKDDNEPIFDASRRTVERMVNKLGPLDAQKHVIDLGGGYGGAMRYLAAKFGCRCTVLNVSEVENERDRQMNRKQGLDNLITVIDGDFANVSAADATYDHAWSQDAILHSDNREKVISEIARTLKPGGAFVLTDPMQTDDCPEGVLDPIYKRIHLDSLATPRFYIDTAERHGLELVEFEEHAHQLTRHYGRVRQELIDRRRELLDAGVSEQYIDNMKNGLQHWVDGGQRGYLTWGIFHFRKRGE